MEQLTQVIRQMIQISEAELRDFLSGCIVRTFRKKAILSHPGVQPNEIFFINKGCLRVLVTDRDGSDHTIHFALENQFIADYSAFMLKKPAIYALEALEEVEMVVIPRSSIEWGYRHLDQGDRLGRLIAEFYFIYQDNRINNLYSRTPKERYDTITEVFPDIHNRAPQHMIASYLGVTPVHLSRLKKEERAKI